MQLHERVELAKAKGVVPDYSPFPDPSNEFHCEYNCGRTWPTEKTMKAQINAGKHPVNDCWPRREQLLAPWRFNSDPSHNNSNGLVVCIKGETRKAVITGDNNAVWITGNPVSEGRAQLLNGNGRKPLPKNFWKHKELEYVAESDRFYQTHKQNIKAAMEAGRLFAAEAAEL